VQPPTDNERDAGDAIDEIREQWQRLRPDLDVDVIDIVGRLSRAAALIVRASDLLLSRYELTRGEFDILTALRRTGTPQSPGALRTVGLATGPATTKRLRSLVARGYVERSVNPADGRGALIALTPAGRELIDEVFPSVLRLERDLMRDVPGDEWPAAVDALRRIVGSVETHAEIT